MLVERASWLEHLLCRGKDKLEDNGAVSESVVLRCDSLEERISIRSKFSRYKQKIPEQLGGENEDDEMKSILTLSPNHCSTVESCSISSLLSSLLSSSNSSSFLPFVLFFIASFSCSSVDGRSWLAFFLFNYLCKNFISLTYVFSITVERNITVYSTKPTKPSNSECIPSNNVHLLLFPIFRDAFRFA